MKTGRAAFAAAAGCAVAVTTAAAPAAAAPTEAATLTCGTAQYQVTGFGRGQILQVVGERAVFVVTRAELTGGQILFDAPGQADRTDIVSCTATPPGSARAFFFEGFFTPRA